MFSLHGNARKARRRLRQLTADTACQLLAPGVKLPRRDAMLLDDLPRSDARLQTRRDDLTLLLDRP